MRKVPPLAVDGLNTLSTPALKPVAADPEEVEELELLVEPPPQAASPRLAAAGTASAAAVRVLLIWVSHSPSGTVELLRGRSAGPGVEGVAQAVTEEVEGEHGEEDGQSGRHHEPRVDLVPAGGGAEHAAPRRGGRLDADAEERQGGLEEDVRRDEEGRVDEDRREEVRQHLPAQDVAAPGAQAASGVDELAFTQRQGLASDDPADVGPAEEADDEHQDADLQRVAAETEGRVRDDARQRDGEDEQREGQEDVHQAADEAVDPAAEEGRGHAHGHADDHGQSGRQERDERGDAAGVDDPAEEVAPVDGFDAEEELPARPAEAARRSLQVGIDQALVELVRR